MAEVLKRQTSDGADSSGGGGASNVAVAAPVPVPVAASAAATAAATAERSQSQPHSRQPNGSIPPTAPSGSVPNGRGPALHARDGDGASRLPRAAGGVWGSGGDDKPTFAQIAKYNKAEEIGSSGANASSGGRGDGAAAQAEA